MADCLFCKMAAGEIKPKVAYEDNDILAFHDINPQAPVHLLVIPKKHIEKISDLGPADAETIAKVVCGAQKIAAKNSWNDYRLVFNNGPEAGQTVYHVHLHLLSGRRMTWPPG
jgi:histidine triad (HIT) family protein